MQPLTINYHNYTITTDKSLMKPADIHRWLSREAYWCKDIPFNVVQTAFDHSFCIGVLHEGKQIAYGRLITDYATFAYLADVYVEEKHQGKGLGKKMMELLLDADWVKGLRRLMLATLDAHGLYEQYGFTQTAFPERFMEINRPGIYQKEKMV